MAFHTPLILGACSSRCECPATWWLHCSCILESWHSTFYIHPSVWVCRTEDETLCCWGIYLSLPICERLVNQPAFSWEVRIASTENHNTVFTEKLVEVVFSLLFIMKYMLTIIIKRDCSFFFYWCTGGEIMHPKSKATWFHGCVYLNARPGALTTQT